MRITIVTDSTADIPPQLAAEHQITVIPAILVVNGVAYEDGKGLSRREFYEQMPTMKTPPTTATPATGVFQQAYEQLFKAGYDRVISIHVSSKLSGIYNTAKMAAQSFDNLVRVIDSQQLSLGIGYQALFAAKYCTGENPIERVLHEIETIQQRVRVIAMLDTLEYVHRSGRVSWARARIGSLLRIKPFVEVKNGRVLSLGQARSRRKGIDHLMNLCKKNGPFEALTILHTNAETDALELADQFKNATP